MPAKWEVRSAGETTTGASRILQVSDSCRLICSEGRGSFHSGAMICDVESRDLDSFSGLLTLSLKRSLLSS